MKVIKIKFRISVQWYGRELKLSLVIIPCALDYCLPEIPLTKDIKFNGIRRTTTFSPHIATSPTSEGETYSSTHIGNHTTTHTTKASTIIITTTRGNYTSTSARTSTHRNYTPTTANTTAHRNSSSTTARTTPRRNYTSTTVSTTTQTTTTEELEEESISGM